MFVFDTFFTFAPWYTLVVAVLILACGVSLNKFDVSGSATEPHPLVGYEPLIPDKIYLYISHITYD